MKKDMIYLKDCAAALIADGFSADVYLELGDAAERIVHVAIEHKCDLIAMSTHGHKAIKDLFLGSVASAVRHSTSIPVLLVRSDAGVG